MGKGKADQSSAQTAGAAWGCGLWPQALRMIWWCLIFSLALVKGIALSHPQEHTPPTISISIEATALGPGRPTAARLTALGQELLLQLFPKELASSAKVFGRIAGSVQKDGTPSFELQATFLYRQTYTAVNKRVVFSLVNDRAVVLSME
jgi:hypothetical protein